MAFTQESTPLKKYATEEQRKLAAVIRDMSAMASYVDSSIAAIPPSKNLADDNLVSSDLARTFGLFNDLDTSSLTFTRNNGTPIIAMEGDGNVAIGQVAAASTKLVLKNETGSTNILLVKENNNNTLLTLTNAGEWKTESALVRKLNGAGTHKTVMGGALSTDIFSIRNSADTFSLFNIDGIGNVWSNGKNAVSTNTVYGEFALDGADVGTNNTVFGQYALTVSNSCDFMTAFGKNAGASVTSAQKGVLVGYQAGTGATSAFGIVAVGYRAGASAGTAGGLTLVGNESGDSITGGYNTCLGARSGYGLTSGTYNTFVGQTAGGNGITTGDYNTIIGGGISALSTSLASHVILTDGQGNQAFKRDNNDNVILGAESALATTATDGFNYVRGGAGAPTGTPATSITGHVPMYADTTNNRLYIYSGGAWVALN